MCCSRGNLKSLPQQDLSSVVVAVAFLQKMERDLGFR